MKKSFLYELKINKYKYILELIAVTFGVLLAAQISSCQQKNEANRKTNQLINLTMYEIDENVSICTDIIYINRDSSKALQNYSIIKNNSLIALLDNENLSLVLNTEQIYLLRAYQSIIYKINYLSDSYINYMLNSIMLSDINLKSIRDALFENAAALIAIAKMIDLTLIGYYEKESPKENFMKNYQKRIIEDINKIKEGKFKVEDK